MRKKISFNHAWHFHMGELKQKVEKFTAKAGTCGGASSLTAEEGFSYQLPEHLAVVLGADKGNSFLNIAPRLEGKWEEVDLPHDWKIRKAYEQIEEDENCNKSDAFKNEAVNGYLPDDVGYYRKRFKVSGSAVGKRVVIEFEGIMRDSVIWVNGSYIGSHLSGYTGIAFDITEYLYYGDEGENVILVKTDSHYKEGWWAEGAGIYRNVWLYYLEPIHVKRHGIFVYTREISEMRAYICAETEVENKSCNRAEKMLRHRILDTQGKEVSRSETTFCVDALEKMKVVQELILPKPILWELDNPYLYSLVTEIYDPQEFGKEKKNRERTEEEVYDLRCREPEDCCETSFGVRSISYTQEGLWLNGRLTEIKGVCEHQDFAGVGIALTEDIIDYKLERIKDMGANAYRSAHHPATEYLLQACDRMGILVLNENRRLEVNPEGLQDLEELIKGSRNHPCIFMWSLENEEFITLHPPGKRLLRTLVAHAKKLDPTRLCTMAGQFAKNDIDYVSIPDVAGFNYDAGDAEKMRKLQPDLLTITSEDSSFVSTRGIYEDDQEKGYCDSYDSGNYYMKRLHGKEPGISTGTAGGVVAPGYFVYAWNHYKKEAPQLGGMFLWTAFDYRGETFPWNWPSVNSHYGAMDMCGFAKDVYYYWRSLWTAEPMVHLLPHWNWEGREGQEIYINVYSNCEEVELFLNGRSQGRKPHENGMITSWPVAYEPGELCVKAYKGGQEAASACRVTVGVPHQVKLQVLHNGKTEVLVSCTILDQEGRICPTADNLVCFAAENGLVTGVGNGNPSSHESDLSDRRRAFNGLCMAIVKKDNDSLKITARSEGLRPDVLLIEN